jgi:hypothetical protein
MSKSEIFGSLSESTGLTKQQIAGLFENLSNLEAVALGMVCSSLFRWEILVGCPVKP